MFHRSTSLTVLLALLLGLGMALAQSAPVTNSYDLIVTDQKTVNTCSSGEPVSLNGVMHFSYSVSTDSSAVNHFSVSVANNLTGVGQNTGTYYAANDSDQYNSNNDDTSADLTVELKSDLKSQGSAPGMTLVQSLHIVVDTSGNISAQVVSNATGCGS
jgi:hypothetical protein